ncbi:MAG: hypothetical protein J3K34DRAFT_265567 [Monoraphidium minutum]|nr:MAG: hypothetical protein J3K34DRAFT_265567 [Monoraphidium minutum]
MRRPSSGPVPNGLPQTHAHRGSGGRRPARPRTQLFKVLAFATVACGCFTLLAIDPGLLAGGAPSSAAHRLTAWVSREPEALAFSLWWHAPFYSVSGLGNEAITILDSLITTRLMRASDIWITHAGDTPNPALVETFPRRRAGDAGGAQAPAADRRRLARQDHRAGPRHHRRRGG